VPIYTRVEFDLLLTKSSVIELEKII
jgi:hypothetical protein